ncbi:MAG: 6-bladed beta-propeller [bacterium]|nr:6-bladed beta-propeller [bacterium]
MLRMLSIFSVIFLQILTAASALSQDVKIEFIRAIGDIESSDENYLFYMPSDIASDQDGNLYILDSGNHRIQIFYPDGNYAGTIGEEGQGPGEFKYPCSLDIDENGSLYVSDQGNFRIQILDPGGRSLKTIRMSEGVGSIRILNPERIMLGSSGGVLGQIIGGSSAGDKTVRIIGRTGAVLNSIGPKQEYNDLMMNRMGNAIHFTSGSDGAGYISFAYQNRIEKYSPEGRLLLQIERELNYDLTPPKPESVEAENDMVRMREPEMNRCSNGIAVDSKNRIWVITLNRQMKDSERIQTDMNVRRDASGNRAFSVAVSSNNDIRKTDVFCLEIFDGNGVLSGRIPLTHFADDIRIIDDKLYILDKFRGMQYYEYAIIEQ